MGLSITILFITIKSERWAGKRKGKLKLFLISEEHKLEKQKREESKLSIQNFLRIRMLLMEVFFNL